MRAVVTGCAGFIGSHLTARLLAEGWEVVGVDALRPYYSPVEKIQAMAGFQHHERFTFLGEDVVELPLRDLLTDRPVVFHLAAQPGVRGSFGQGFDRYVHDNVTATQRLFEAGLQAGVPRIVYASSSSVYGNAPSYPCVEGATTPNPVSPYGVTKATCEQLAEVYRGLGLDAVGLRYFTVYGPNQRPDMAMRRLCEAAFGGPPFRLFGDGSQSRDFTHVDDAVQATVLAAGAASPAPVMNIGGGQEATLSRVIDLVSSLAGRRPVIERDGVQRGDVHRTGADTTRAGETIGWEPAVPLEDGLATQVEWVRARNRQRGPARLAAAAAGT